MLSSGVRSRLVLLVACISGAANAACAEGEPVESGFVDLTSGAGGASSATASASSTTAATTSAASTTSSGTGHGGSAATSTTATTSTGPSCDDTGIGEPNDSESKAFTLAAIDDCDGSGSSLQGVIAGPDDADWYKYSGDDTSFCSVDATRDLTSTDSLRICKFAQCVSGTATPDCPLGTAADTSPDGRPGCCSLQGFSMGVDCSGIDDDATIFVRIDSIDGADCASYSLDYHY